MGGERKRRFEVIAGRGTITLALLSASLILMQPLVGKIPACKLPEWLEHGLRSLALSSVLLTVVASLVCIFLGARWGLTSISIVAFALTAFLMVAIRTSHENFYGERVAMSTLRTINIAEVEYATSHGGAWGTLDDLVDAMLLDSRFKQRTVFGYRYDIAFLSDGYLTTATRDVSNCAARWNLFSKPDGIIKYSTDPASAPHGKAGQAVD